MARMIEAGTVMVDDVIRVPGHGSGLLTVTASEVEFGWQFVAAKTTDGKALTFGFEYHDSVEITRRGEHTF